MATPRGERIQANCKRIWGDGCDYDLDSETDDYEHYACIVRKDFGLSLGPPLTMTTLCRSEEAAFVELDRMLQKWAMQIERGSPMTKAEKLDIFGGGKRTQENLLGIFIDALEKKEGKGSG